MLTFIRSEIYFSIWNLSSWDNLKAQQMWTKTDICWTFGPITSIALLLCKTSSISPHLTTEGGGLSTEESFLHMASSRIYWQESHLRPPTDPLEAIMSCGTGSTVPNSSPENARKLEGPGTLVVTQGSWNVVTCNFQHLFDSVKWRTWL